VQSREQVINTLLRADLPTSGVVFIAARIGQLLGDESPPEPAPFHIDQMFEPLANQGVALGDEGAVPCAAILLAEGHQLPGSRHACRPPGVSEQHQGQQAGYLAVVREQSSQQAAEADRLVGEVDTHRIVPRTGAMDSLKGR
jgi:hypothetical protein